MKENLKSFQRGKKRHCVQRTKYKNESRFFTKILQVKGKYCDIFKLLKEINHQSKMLYIAKCLLINEVK